jgi:hypothetical protein
MFATSARLHNVLLGVDQHTEIWLLLVLLLMLVLLVLLILMVLLVLLVLMVRLLLAAIGGTLAVTSPT